MDDMRDELGYSEEDSGGMPQVVEPKDSLWETLELPAGNSGQAR